MPTVARGLIKWRGLNYPEIRNASPHRLLVCLNGASPNCHTVRKVEDLSGFSRQLEGIKRHNCKGDGGFGQLRRREGRRPAVNLQAFEKQF